MNTVFFADPARAIPALSPLPITPFLGTICRTLTESPSRFLVLTAETAAGKSTAVPVALLQAFSGKILMLEPRRLAAVAIAGRVAELLGERVGETSGYRLHLESRIGKNTRLEVMTEAILTRRLQNDPALDGVSVVVLDEFHERSVHSDVALAFLKETMLLREDLYVVVMSATMNARTVAAYLDNAPVLEIPGRQFPVQIEYAPDLSPVQAVLHCLAEEDVAHNAGATHPAGGESGAGGSILVFLPGIAEIRRTKAELEATLGARTAADGDVSLLVLHSSVPLSEQRAVLSPASSAASGADSPLQGSPRTRIILSSAIAETSLTVPDVTTVIDSGRARLNRMNVALGMEKLVTERVSRFSADQRAGRAGRMTSGRCIRLWNQFDVLTEQAEPEILRTDLAPLVLECAAWGATSVEKLDWLSEPPRAAWQQAQALLASLGCIHADSGTITEKGKQVLLLGIHPRLACVALFGKENGALSQAVDCVFRFSQPHAASNAAGQTSLQKAFCADLTRRLQGAATPVLRTARLSTGELLLAGFPDRIGQRIADGAGMVSGAARESTEYQFPNGRKARLFADSAQGFPRFLVAPEVDAGTTTAHIYRYEPLTDEVALSWLSARATVSTETVFADDSVAGKSMRLIKTEYTACGALVLKERQLPASAEDYSAAVCSAVRRHGVDWLPLNEESKSLLVRAQFYAAHTPAGDALAGIVQTDAALRTAASDTAAAASLSEKLTTLQERVQDWLCPFLTGGKITPEIVYQALSWYLSAQDIDRAVPTQLTLSNGKRRRLVYEDNGKGVQPVLEVIIQQMFGCFETPRILGVPVLLKLLSPARRPLQVTDDLAGFWSGSWIEICKEMKGRYPKHNWDYRIAQD